ncbi:glycosyltransferase [Evansella sp. AB-P1]|uniref:glycosyltransferase family 2 protein n=1 Tax=Evansella sp. AB-P1 TaxID=3037653 RepID=UPI00241E0627|nr:glycosyltransferase [Evansella sp. AB-P1]MDG5786356.1 glycosyltransferase [Evansella sp. AB-P1]
MFLKITLVLFFIYMLFQLIYIFVPLFAVKSKNRFSKLEKEKGISILIPAYNEEKVILNCLQGIVNLKYKNYEAIFINDGSSDQTLNILKEHLQLEPTFQRLPAIKIPHEAIIEVYQSKLYPKILVIDKENGGKADALNAGIEYLKKEIVITLDADSILEPHSLQAMNKAFEDEKVIAAGGMVQIGQGFHGNFLRPKPTFLTSGIIRYQIIQYLTAFYLHKFTLMKMSSITVIAGAFGAFRKNILFEIDGFRKTVGEDMDITLRIQRLVKTKYKDCKLIFNPQATCYTECPETYKALFNQRIRWQKAFMDCVITYRTSFFNRFGFRLSIFFLIEAFLLGTLSAFPIIFIPIILIFNLEHYMIALGLLTVTFFLGNYQSFSTLVVSRRFGLRYHRKDYLKIATFIPIEIITYRLLGLAFVISGTIMYFINKEKWNVATRIGTNSQSYDEGVLLLNEKTVFMNEKVG